MKTFDFLMFAAIAVIATASIASAQTSGGLGLRASLGTDVTLGLGVGAGAAYSWVPTEGGTAFEFGADLFYHRSSEEEQEPVTRYQETTTLILFTVRANGLFNYHPKKAGVYFIAGFGFIVANMNWERKSISGVARPTDDEEATAAGNIVNLGIGIVLGRAWDLRLETPMLYFYNTAGGATSFAPTFTVGVVYKLK